MRRSKRFWIIVFGLLLLAGAWSSSVCFLGRLTPPAEPTVSRTYDPARTVESEGRAVLFNYCSGCHTRGRSGADFDDQTSQVSAMRRDRATWASALRKVRAGTMPPEGFPQPDDEDRQALIAWIEQALQTDLSDAAGSIMARRLQRSEYMNAVRDLFGMALTPPSDLPADDRGWDRCRDVPELSGSMLEMYGVAAAAILAEALTEELASLVPSACDPDDPDAAVILESSRGTHWFVSQKKGLTEVEHAREMLGAFAHRAYRRPADAGEMDRLVAVFERAGQDGASFEDRMRAALHEVLTAPHFLFRIERRADRGNAPGSPANQEQLTLASRLSFFLWSSTPDQELLDQAEKGVLTQNLPRQVERMLKDSRARSLPVSFAAQWLSLDQVKPTGELDEPLAHAMRQETELFVQTIIRDDRSVLEFLDADYTFLNERLAKHYGIAGVQGEHMRRVSLTGTQRGGLITQASILHITSSGPSSPVLRGKWVLENLLGEPAVRPPAGLLKAIQNATKVTKAGTVREQMAEHRANPSCAACHTSMDALGLALESFDANGAWRAEWRAQPVDPSAVLSSGETLSGPKELKAYLLTQRKRFVRALGASLLSHALGRKLDERDRDALSRLPDDVAAHDFRFARVVLAVVQSEPFQAGWRR